MGYASLSKMLGTTAIVGSAFAAPASAQQKTGGIIDVPSQELVTAIEELSAETGRPIAVNADAVGSQRSRAVRGPMTARQALEIMIADPDVFVSEFGDGSLVVTRNAFNLVAQNETDVFDLGTLVLRGERVERDVFNTASSVEAFDGEAIDANPQDNDLESVFDNAANITTGTGNQAPTIRGINSAGEISGGALGTLAGALPRASFTVDGRNLTANETIYGTTSVFDTEVVEVFRGPQTTSQGANAIAGAINVRTRNPVFEQEFAARGEVAEDDGRAFSLMANTPLSDSFAARFVYDYEKQDLFFDLVPDGVAIREAEERRQETARLKLLWEPVDLPQLSTQLTLSYSEFHAPQNQSLTAPFDDLESDTNGFPPPAFIGDTRALIHDISYDFENGFSVRNQFQYSDADSLRTNGTGGLGDFPQNIRDRSNETILTYDPAGGSLTGILGFYVRETEETSPGSELFDLDGERTGRGIFGEFTQRFQNGFDVTAGLRYQENDQRRIGSSFFSPTPLLDVDAKFRAWLPRLAVGYDYTENTRFAFQVSRGYNPGGGAVILTTLEGYEFDEEFVTNYELSVRHRSADGRLFLTGNLFYSDYEDYQLFVDRQVPPAPPLFSTQAGRVFNVDDVKTFGFEGTAAYQLNDDLVVNGSLGLLNTDVGALGQEVADFTGGDNVSDNELPFAPSLTLGIGADYQITPRFNIGGQVNYTGDYFSTINNEAGTKVGDFAIVDIRASYLIDDGIEFYGYVNNLFDTLEETSVSADGRFGSITPPREIGLGIRATF